MAIIDTEKLKLRAVNILLQTIGELPIQDEEDIDVLVEAQVAETTLDEVTSAVLSEGWDFNTDSGYTFPIALDGTIPIPYNVLELSSDDADLIMRQWKIYSKGNNSFIFTEPQEVNILWNLNFNELTHPIRHYITIRAARIFSARNIGDSAAFQYTKEDEMSAMYAARHSESRTGKYNMLDGEFGQEYDRGI